MSSHYDIGVSIIKRRSLLTLLPVFVIYIIIFRFIYLEDGLSDILGACMPIFIGLFLAEILNPILVFFQDAMNIRSRYFAIFLTYTLLLSFLGIIITMITPGLMQSISLLLKDIPKLYYEANQLLLDFKGKYEISDKSNSLYLLMQEYLFGISKRLSSLLSELLNLAIYKIINVFAALGNLLLSLIISIYILIDKEKIEIWFNKLCYSFLEKKYAAEIIHIAKALNENISSFISARILDSFIIGILTFLCSKFIINAPYPIIDGLLIGITNIIPYFGSFIGAVPTVFINLLYNPYKGFLFTILIIILQEIDSLVIGPKILSNQLSIKPIIIIISIIIGGGLFGPIGLFLAVPVAALIKTSIDAFMKFKLKDSNIYFPHEKK